MTHPTTAPVSNKPGPLLLLALCALFSLLSACSGGGGSSTPPLEPVLAAPTFTPVPGTYLGPQTVSITDGTGAPSPGKLTVTCPGGTCPFTKATWQQHLLLDEPPGGAAVMAFVPPSGTLSLTLPPVSSSAL